MFLEISQKHQIICLDGTMRCRQPFFGRCLKYLIKSPAVELTSISRRTTWPRHQVIQPHRAVREGRVVLGAGHLVEKLKLKALLPKPLLAILLHRYANSTVGHLKPYLSPNPVVPLKPYLNPTPVVPYYLNRKPYTLNSRGWTLCC